MRLRVTRVADGPGPDEIIVGVETFAGNIEHVILDTSVILGDMIEVGSPIHFLEDKSLVELPRESTSGKWRIWVPISQVT